MAAACETGDQCTSSLMMVRPLNFFANPETLEDNVFQNTKTERTNEQIAKAATAEFDTFVELLRHSGIDVTVFEDAKLPDAVFPNNWISAHSSGVIYLYPMKSELRRQERKRDIVAAVQKRFGHHTVVDLSGHEASSQFLEGTGSLVLDRVNKVAYACISERMDPVVLERWAKHSDFTTITFTATNSGKDIYHTNVLMSVGSKLAIVCFEAIPDALHRERVRSQLEQHGHEVVDITCSQLENFAGNMLEVKSKDDRHYLVMSNQAFGSLRPEQIAAIEKHCAILHTDLSTIEHFGGGSARCMIAELFGPPQADKQGQ